MQTNCRQSCRDQLTTLQTFLFSNWPLDQPTADTLINVPEERAWEFYCSVIASLLIEIIFQDRQNKVRNSIVL